MARTGRARSASSCPGEQRPVEQSLPGPGRGLPDFRSPAAGFGVILRRLFAEGSSFGRGRRSTRSIPASIRPRSTGVGQPQSARASAEAARPGPSVTSRWRKWRRCRSRTIPTRWLRPVRPMPRSPRTMPRSTAQINLRYTRVPAPISGRIGLSTFTEGALVTANQAEHLPPSPGSIRSTSTSSSRRPTFCRCAGRCPEGHGTDHGPGPASRCRTAATMATPAPIQFTEVVVNADTGSVTLRARFPNPQSLLLPGMFVTAQLCPGDQHDGLSGAAAGGGARSDGNAIAWVVGPGNTAVQRTVVAERTDGRTGS